MMPFPLPPPATLKPQDRQQGTERNERQDVRISPTPTVLGHVVKIHAVHTRDECRRNPDHGYDGEHLENVVLLSVDKTKNRVQQELRFTREMGFEVD